MEYPFAEVLAKNELLCTCTYHVYIMYAMHVGIGERDYIKNGEK
jgi:hypothetical protein